MGMSSRQKVLASLSQRMKKHELREIIGSVNRLVSVSVFAASETIDNCTKS